MTKFKRICLLVLLFTTASVSFLEDAKCSAFSFNSFNYTVTSTTEVTLTGGSISNSESLIVPDYVYNEGKRYAVTKVAQHAFSSYRGQKVVIGDNVTTIENKAFEHFGEHTSNNFLILGKSISILPKKAFEHLGEHGSNNKIILKCTNVPSIDKQTFEHLKNTTLYVKDEQTYLNYLNANVWYKYDEEYNSQNNKYQYPFPYENEIIGGKWLTGVFPENLSTKDILNIFGEGTKVAYLHSASYDATKGEYILRFEYTTTINANTPYLFKIGNSEADYVAEIQGNPSATTLTKSVSVSNKSGYRVEMIGVFSVHYLSKDEFYLRNQDDVLYFYVAQEGGRSFVNPNKCYFHILDDSGNISTSKVGCVFEDLEPTGVITSIVKETNNDTYNLYGQCVGKNHRILPKGVYIINGKKILIK